MKFSLMTLILFILPTLVWADPWDNLTLEEAQEVQEYLSANPFILDYCDCCDHEGEYAAAVYLMRVTETEIVTCDWNDEYYSIKASVEVLARVPYNDNGLDLAAPKMANFQESLIITMNYTWGYSAMHQKSTPLYAIIPYDGKNPDHITEGSCRPFTAFPVGKAINDSDYKKWYRSRF